LNQPGVNVEVATIQTIQSKVARGEISLASYDLAIGDEMHNYGTTSRMAVIQSLDRVVGMTATPIRHSGYLKRPEEYGFDIVHSLPLIEAQERRLLPPLIGIQVTTAELVDEIPTTPTGKIDYRRLEKLLKDSPDLRPFIADKLASIMVDSEGRRYKTGIVCNFVWEAEELAKLLFERGIKVGVAVNQAAARSIHTKEIPSIDAIERFKLPHDDERAVQGLLSPYVASEGFDAPFMEILAWTSPTDSPLRYTQYTGRLARRANGKLFGVIVDFLYQTSQYSWSYNLGMWMKGNVRQLENGLLYLGPESDIEGLKKLPIIENFRSQADVMPIRALEKEALLGIQPTDFPLTQIGFRIFYGDVRKIHLASKQVINNMKEANSDIVQRRRHGPRTIEVVTDRASFIKQMQEAGLDLIPNDSTEGVLNISIASLETIFVGSRAKINGISNPVIQRLKISRPEIFMKIMAGSHLVEAVTERDFFIQMLVEEGLQLIPNSTEVTGIEFTETGLGAVFAGNRKRLKQLAESVIGKIKNRGIDILVPHSKKTRHIQVISNPELFIKEMVKEGATLNEELPEVQPNSFLLTQINIMATFGGDTKRVWPLAQQVFNKLEETSPQDVARKYQTQKDGKRRRVGVINNKNRFIQEMNMRGVRLKAQSSPTD